jgi:hypothetical protein
MSLLVCFSLPAIPAHPVQSTAHSNVPPPRKWKYANVWAGGELDNTELLRGGHYYTEQLVTEAVQLEDKIQPLMDRINNIIENAGVVRDQDGNARFISLDDRYVNVDPWRKS